jgi:hypothetical protein
MARKRHTCECGRPIVARKPKHYGGVFKPNNDHDLCQKCWKAYNDRIRARPLLLEAVVKFVVGEVEMIETVGTEIEQTIIGDC